eukprot:SAG11_NODE_1169_length_5616_cov_44.787566_2_plen_45_part_00
MYAALSRRNDRHKTHPFGAPRWRLPISIFLFIYFTALIQKYPGI